MTYKDFVNKGGFNTISKLVSELLNKEAKQKLGSNFLIVKEVEVRDGGYENTDWVCTLSLGYLVKFYDSDQQIETDGNDLIDTIRYKLIEGTIIQGTNIEFQWVNITSNVFVQPEDSEGTIIYVGCDFDFGLKQRRGRIPRRAKNESCN